MFNHQFAAQINIDLNPSLFKSKLTAWLWPLAFSQDIQYHLIGSRNCVLTIGSFAIFRKNNLVANRFAHKYEFFLNMPACWENAENDSKLFSTCRN